MIQSVNNSYVVGFLHSHFQHVQDLYMDKGKHFADYPENSILYIDDELYYFLTKQEKEEFVRQHSHQILIFKIKKYFDLAKRTAIKSIFFPWADVLDEALAFNLITRYLDIKLPVDNELAFSCLNRRYSSDRVKTISHLNKQGLLECGAVTGSAFKHKVATIKDNDLDSYTTPNGVGFERHSDVFHGIPVSQNTLNIIRINEIYRQPINVTVETTLSSFFPTEKSALAFLTKRLPIIITEPGGIADLRIQGFDMFDDIINHDYDLINEHNKRIHQAIDLNLDVLTHPVKITQSLIERLNFNFNHFTNTWPYAKLQELQSLIHSQLSL